MKKEVNGRQVRYNKCLCTRKTIQFMNNIGSDSGPADSTHILKGSEERYAREQKIVHSV